jgi:hypothetical protein
MEKSHPSHLPPALYFDNFKRGLNGSVMSLLASILFDRLLQTTTPAPSPVWVVMSCYEVGW